jgi:hypothetical protein
MGLGIITSVILENIFINLLGGPRSKNGPSENLCSHNRLQCEFIREICMYTTVIN